MMPLFDRAGGFTSLMATALIAGMGVAAQQQAAVSLEALPTSSATVFELAQVTVDSPDSRDADSAGDDVPTPTSEASRFSCQFENGEYTVMYNPESQPQEFYPWAAPGEMGGGWSADRRCSEISRRLEVYRPDGLLELRTSVENGYDIVCVTTEADPSCRIVFTVPRGQDPLQTRDRVFENLAVANSGQATEAVNTFDGEGDRILSQIGQELGINLPSIPGRSAPNRQSASINLRPFLDPADGGTGSALRQESPSLLNPADFR
ncbi:MAG: COP23 domain-containing protein [Elainellaceae cyanobacterium]